MGFDGCVNLFKSRLLGLCEKLGVGFVGADVGLLRILACMSEILRLFSLFQKFGGV